MKQAKLSKLTIIFIFIIAIIIGFFIANTVSLLNFFNKETKQKIVYVDLNKISIDNSSSETNNKKDNHNGIEFTNIKFPKLLSTDSYKYVNYNVPYSDLYTKTKLSQDELKNILDADLKESLDISKERNLTIANIRNYSNIIEYEEYSRNIMHEKIKENTTYKINSYVKWLASYSYSGILSTEKNLEKTDLSYSNYLFNRSVPSAYFYLYNDTMQAFKLQEEEKTKKEIGDKAKEYLKKQEDIIAKKINKSNNVIDEIINNIKSNEINNTFSFNKLDNNISESMLDVTKNNTGNIYNISKPNREYIKSAILEIAKDLNYKVIFEKKKNIPDHTDEFQKIINKYGYLYWL